MNKGFEVSSTIEENNKIGGFDIDDNYKIIEFKKLLSYTIEYIDTKVQHDYTENCYKIKIDFTKDDTWTIYSDHIHLDDKDGVKHISKFLAMVIYEE